jgi:hypothetical protein
MQGLSSGDGKAGSMGFNVHKLVSIRMAHIYRR